MASTSQVEPGRLVLLSSTARVRAAGRVLLVDPIERARHDRHSGGSSGTGRARPRRRVDGFDARIEQFAPGFRDRIVGTAVRSTTEMSQYNPNFVGGDIIGGESSPRQLVFRPRIALDPYSTGIPGTYLCSASTPPGAGAHGMCGANAADRALSRI